MFAFFNELDKEWKASEKLKEALNMLDRLQGNDFKTPTTLATIEVSKRIIQEALDILH